jgi:hypothetical protein
VSRQCVRYPPGPRRSSGWTSGRWPRRRVQAHRPDCTVSRRPTRRVDINNILPAAAGFVTACYRTVPGSSWCDRPVESPTSLLPLPDGQPKTTMNEWAPASWYSACLRRDLVSGATIRQCRRRRRRVARRGQAGDPRRAARRRGGGAPDGAVCRDDPARAGWHSDRLPTGLHARCAGRARRAGAPARQRRRQRRPGALRRGSSRAGARCTGGQGPHAGRSRKVAEGPRCVLCSRARVGPGNRGAGPRRSRTASRRS